MTTQQIIEEYPPNFSEIQAHFDLTNQKPVFAWGDKIYNPFKIEIPPDMLYHEYIHWQQQKHYTTPAIWWTKYIMDNEFRLEEEVEAYAHQYLFVKKHTPQYVYREMLEEAAENLSSPLYNLGITKNQAEAMIKRKAKTITLFQYL